MYRVWFQMMLYSEILKILGQGRGGNRLQGNKAMVGCRSGTQHGRGWHRLSIVPPPYNSRRVLCDLSLTMALWGRSRCWMDNRRTSRGTIPRHFRTCRRIRVHSAPFAPLDKFWFFCNLHHTMRHCRAYCSRCRCSCGSGFRLGRRIPTGPPWAKRSDSQMASGWRICCSVYHRNSLHPSN